MPERFPQNTITLDHLSTLLLIIASISLVPLLFIMAVRVAVPASYEPVLPGLSEGYLALIGISVLLLIFIFIIGYYRVTPPTRVATPDSGEGAAEIVAGALGAGVIGLPLFLVSVLFLGYNISEESGGFIHGLVALIPIFVTLAIVLSSIAGFIEARSVANEKSN